MTTHAHRTHDRHEPEGEVAAMLGSRGLRPRFAESLAAAIAPLIAEREAEAWDAGWLAGLQAADLYVWPRNPYRTPTTHEDAQ